MERNKLNAQMHAKKEHYIKIHGDKCIYCGKPMEVFHHIVPVHMGGDNRDSNIVPLCNNCHSKAHSKRAPKHQVNWGRPKIKLPENFDTVMVQYHNSEIGLKEALKLTGMTDTTFYKYMHKWEDETGDHRIHRQLRRLK